MAADFGSVYPGPTEVQYIGDVILNEIDHKRSDCRILLCGLWQDIATCLDHLTTVRPTDHVLSYLTVATSDVTPFIDAYFKDNSPRLNIVNWKERDYEEVLIQKTVGRNQASLFSMAIDFQPSHRRLMRMRKLLAKDATLVIPHESPAWRETSPELMASFSKHGGQLIKLTESLPAAHIAHQMHLWLTNRKEAMPVQLVSAKSLFYTRPSVEKEERLER